MNFNNSEKETSFFIIFSHTYIFPTQKSSSSSIGHLKLKKYSQQPWKSRNSLFPQFLINSLATLKTSTNISTNFIPFHLKKQAYCFTLKNTYAFWRNLFDAKIFLVFCSAGSLKNWKMPSSSAHRIPTGWSSTEGELKFARMCETGKKLINVVMIILGACIHPSILRSTPIPACKARRWIVSGSDCRQDRPIISSRWMSKWWVPKKKKTISWLIEFGQFITFSSSSWIEKLTHLPTNSHNILIIFFKISHHQSRMKFDTLNRQTYDFYIFFFSYFFDSFSLFSYAIKTLSLWFLSLLLHFLTL